MEIEFFEQQGFVLVNKYQFNTKYVSYVFTYEDSCIIIDDHFECCVDKKDFFDYSKYCEMQNFYMNTYEKVFRFNYIDNKEALLLNVKFFIADSNECLLNDDGGHFNEIHIDNTPLEKEFEDVFCEAFGNDSLACIHKEVSISCDGGNYFIDFVLETTKGKYAFEENGVSYHHPCLIDIGKYDSLLKKQNVMMSLGYKVYRFSTDNLHFKDKVIQDLKSFLPDKSTFLPKSIIKNTRGLELYKHQSDILKQLATDRINGKTTSLIVIPTAAGKSEICITDLEQEYIKEQCKRVLIMVSSDRIKKDWLVRIEPIKDLYEIDVCFYNVVFTHKNEKPQDYYDYIIFDEAHHAQAANCKASIQYFTPKYLVGLTATDERLDHKKLEDIFGNYEVKLTLKEAIEKDIVTNIRTYRLESNIDLKEVRYNGKDYNSSDLEKRLFVDSRNELIADVLLKYFNPKIDFYKQGIIFCVNTKHTIKMASMLQERGLKAEAVYGGNSKNDEIFAKYKNKEIQFLCSCQLISEGWDSPQTEVVVMARPTLSKVLYLQQIGRGLRKYPGKECLYLIDVVDNYSAELRPWNFNSLFHISQYSPFMGVKDNHYDYFSILGLNEYELAMKEIDIFTFEEKYKDYLSLEQAARELYIGTNTLNNWNKKNNYASLYLPVGNRQMPYFSNDDIENIRKKENIGIHNDDNVLEDFIDFTNDKTFTFSFKMVFLICCFKCVDNEGNIDVDKLLEEYKRYYISRLKKGLPVDKSNCIYTMDYLDDYEKIKKNMLDNPFEKYERKRFFYQSKDLNIISFNSALWSKMDDNFIDEIVQKELKYLKEYYEKYGGYDDEYQF